MDTKQIQHGLYDPLMPPAVTQTKKMMMPSSPGAAAGEKATSKTQSELRTSLTTAKGDKRKYVQHSYTDRSKDIIENISESDENTLKMYKEDSFVGAGTFPIKLQIVLKVLEKTCQDHIISWLPHGRSFRIHRPREFENKIMGKFFQQTKLSSFQRQLNLYDFQRITHGRDAGAYYHELFLRGRPLLSKRMIRRKIKGTTRAPSSPDDEPNFYQMPYMGPLADDPTPFDHHTFGAPGERSFLRSNSRSFSSCCGSTTAAGGDDIRRTNMMDHSSSAALLSTGASMSWQQQEAAPHQQLGSLQGRNMQESNTMHLQNNHSLSSSLLHQGRGGAAAGGRRGRSSTRQQEEQDLLLEQYYGGMKETFLSSNALRNTLLSSSAATADNSSCVGRGENFPRSLYDSSTSGLFSRNTNDYYYSSLMGATTTASINRPARALAQQLLNTEARLLQESADDRMATRMLNHEEAALLNRVRRAPPGSQEEVLVLPAQQQLVSPSSSSREAVESNLSHLSEVVLADSYNYYAQLLQKLK